MFYETSPCSLWFKKKKSIYGHKLVLKEKSLKRGLGLPETQDFCSLRALFRYYSWILSKVNRNELHKRAVKLASYKLLSKNPQAHQSNPTLKYSVVINDAKMQAKIRK